MSDGSEKITISYDSEGRIVETSSQNSASTTIGTKKIAGTISVHREQVLYFEELGYSLYSLRIKKNKLYLPFSTLVRYWWLSMRKDIRHFYGNRLIWLRRLNDFLGNTTLGQLVIVQINVLFAIWYSGIIFENSLLKLENESDYLKIYLLMLSAFLGLSFGAIGINNAEKRHKEGRKKEISPVFIIKSNGLREHIDATENVKIRSSPSNHGTKKASREDAVYSAFLVKNIGNGAAFNAWLLLDRGNGQFVMTPATTSLSPDEELHVYIETEKNDIKNTKLYIACNDLENNLVVFYCILNVGASVKRAGVLRISQLTENEAKFREINYSLKSFGR